MKRKKWLFSLVALMLIVAALSPISSARKDVQEPGMESGGSHDSPILTMEQAIARSVERFPEDVAPDDVLVRLIDHKAVDEWSSVSDPNWQADAPVWLVALRGEGLTVNSMERGTGLDPIRESADHRPIEGIYYAWDATTGWIRIEGVLMDQATSVRSFRLIQDMSERTFPMDASGAIVLGEAE